MNPRRNETRESVVCLTFTCAWLPLLLGLLILLIFLVLRPASPGLQLLQDGGAELLKAASVQPARLREVVSGEESGGGKALRSRRGKGSVKGFSIKKNLRAVFNFPGLQSDTSQPALL